MELTPIFFICRSLLGGQRYWFEYMTFALCIRHPLAYAVSILLFGTPPQDLHYSYKQLVSSVVCFSPFISDAQSPQSLSDPARMEKSAG